MLSLKKKKMSLTDVCSQALKQEVPEEIVKESIGILGSNEFRRTVFILARMSKPNIVIETGADDIITTKAVVRALKKNNNGHVWSVRENRKGKRLKNETRIYWTLKYFPIENALEGFELSFRSIDMYISNKARKKEEMLREMEWAEMMDAKIIVMNDVFKNKAFMKFTKNKEAYILENDIGVIVLEKKHKWL